MEQHEADKIANNIIRLGATKKKIASDLGISRMTLDYRLKGEREWKRLEMVMLEKMLKDAQDAQKVKT